MSWTTGVSGFRSNGFDIGKISWGGSGQTVRSSVSKAKQGGSSKGIKPRYNYKAISAAIMRAKTPAGANMAATKARRKLGELTRSSTNGENDDPDLRAAIVHLKKMERIAKRKQKHLEQEELAERGETTVFDFDEDDEKELSDRGDLSDSTDDKKDTLEEYERQMAKALSEEMSEQLAELTEELAQAEEEMLTEEFEELEGMEDVTDMKPEDVKQLKQKHRSDEWRDIVKADMEYLKAKFYRLQQEKNNAGNAAFKSYSAANETTGPITEQPMMSMDAELPADTGISIEGAMVDIQV